MPNFDGAGALFEVNGQFNNNSREAGTLNEKLERIRIQFRHFVNVITGGPNHDAPELFGNRIQMIRDSFQEAQNRLDVLLAGQFTKDEQVEIEEVRKLVQNAHLTFITIFEIARSYRENLDNRSIDTIDDMNEVIESERNLMDSPPALAQIEKENSTILKWKVPSTKNVKSQIFSDEFTLPKLPDLTFAFFAETVGYHLDTTLFGIALRTAPKVDPFGIEMDSWFETSSGHKFCPFNGQKSTFKKVGNTIKYKFNTSSPDMIKEVLLTDDTIHVCCELRVITSDELRKKKAGKKLWKLYKEGTGGYDAVIEADGEKFKIRTDILITHSEAFKLMFSDTYREGQERYAKIEDVSSDAMEALICWMYTGQLTNMEILEDLYTVADKYMITNLKNKCAEEMVKELNTENAASHLILAKDHENKELEDMIMDFITKLSPDMMKEVFETPEWFQYLSAKDKCGDFKEDEEKTEDKPKK